MTSNLDGLIINEDKVIAHSVFETSFRSGVVKFKDGANEMAVSLHGMQSFGTWMVAKDDHGASFNTWSDYLVWLADDTGLGRSTLFSYKSAVEFARANEFAVDEDGFLDQDKFLERGGVMTFRRIKEEGVITSRNGMITGLKGVLVDNPIEVVQEIVDTIDPDARPMDQVKFIREVIDEKAGLENKVEINLRLRRSGEGGFNLVWTKESNAGLEEGFVSDPVPDDVLDKLHSEFHILV